VLFTGDIVADGVSDLRGDHCISQTSETGSHNGAGECSHCSCATHSGTVVVADSGIPLAGAPDSRTLFGLSAFARVPKLAVAIDHPPQLA
jgi:hypothetical protein